MFDLTVQHRDQKTGRVREENPYRLHSVSGKTYLERPNGSGNLYWMTGEPAGQIFWENGGKKKVIKELGEYKDAKGNISMIEHIPYSRPLTVNEKMHREYEARGSKIVDQEARIAELEAAAIKAEAKEAAEYLEKVEAADKAKLTMAAPSDIPKQKAAKEVKPVEASKGK